METGLVFGLLAVGMGGGNTISGPLNGVPINKKWMESGLY